MAPPTPYQRGGRQDARWAEPGPGVDSTGTGRQGSRSHRLGMRR
ncbi:unnamed protein product, partial [Protopolystoma xenopodis]